jgi:hypothetical protein
MERSTSFWPSAVSPNWYSRQARTTTTRASSGEASRLATLAVRAASASPER